MSEDQSQRTHHSMRTSFGEYANSGIIRTYVVVTLVSVVVISLYAGSLGAGLTFGGWIGLFAAILINEVTPGFTMEDSWIAGDSHE